MLSNQKQLLMVTKEDQKRNSTLDSALRSSIVGSIGFVKPEDFINTLKDMIIAKKPFGIIKGPDISSKNFMELLPQAYGILGIGANTCVSHCGIIKSKITPNMIITDAASTKLPDINHMIGVVANAANLYTLMNFKISPPNIAIDPHLFGNTKSGNTQVNTLLEILSGYNDAVLYDIEALVDPENSPEIFRNKKRANVLLTSRNESSKSGGYSIYQRIDQKYGIAGGLIGLGDVPVVMPAQNSKPEAVLESIDWYMSLLDPSRIYNNFCREKAYA